MAWSKCTKCENEIEHHHNDSPEYCRSCTRSLANAAEEMRAALVAEYAAEVVFSAPSWSTSWGTAGGAATRVFTPPFWHPSDFPKGLDRLTATVLAPGTPVDRTYSVTLTQSERDTLVNILGRLKEA